MLIISILSPATSTTPTPHFRCSKMDVIWMRTLGTLLFYLLIFFPWEIGLGGETGLWIDSACLLLLLVSPVLLAMWVSFLSAPQSLPSPPSVGPPCLVLSVSFCLHDHVLSLLHDLLALPLLIFRILGFLTDSLLIIVFHFNTDFRLFLPITLD